MFVNDPHARDEEVVAVADILVVGLGWIELWIRKATSPPILSLSRTLLNNVWLGVLILLREGSLVSCSAAISI